MNGVIVALLLALIVQHLNSQENKRYEANWDSLDSRPLPDWYDEAKIGIFLHWGVYSVPSLGSEWFWNFWDQGISPYSTFMYTFYPERFTYQEFAKDFRAEFYDPSAWADIFVNSGAQYVVLTSKHHEGYTMWPSKYSFSWNAKDVGPQRDVLGELAETVRHKDLKFGVYHSLLEWYNPMYRSDANNNFATQDFVIKKALPEMRELVETYKPSIVWSDGHWEALDTYWNSTDFLAWLYNDSPVKDEVVTNDRWGSNTVGIHGGFYTGSDRYNPGTLQLHKFENAMTIDRKSWGYRRNARLSDYLSINELLSELASTVSCGGNLLINIGPTSFGTIAPIFEERLSQLGEWLNINGDAIYRTRPWTHQNDSLAYNVWYTSTDVAVYAILLEWKWRTEYLQLAAPLEVFQKNSNTRVTLLAANTDTALEWKIEDNAVNIKVPEKSKIIVHWAYVFKIEPRS